MTDPDDIDLPDDWQIDIAPPQWHRDVVEVVADFHTRAIRGEVTEVAIAALYRSGGIATAFAGRGDPFKLGGAVNVLLTRIVTEST